MYFRRQEYDIKPDEILIYLRKSRADDRGYTTEEVLEQHEKTLDDWCMEHLGALVPESNKFREVVSGESLKKRVVFQDVLRRIENPKIKAVLVKDTARISRGSLKEIGEIMDLFQYSSTLIFTTREAYDLRDKRDRRDLQSGLMSDNSYLEYFREITHDGVERSCADGNYICSRPPYGYIKTKVMDGKRECPTLIPHPDQAPIVKMIFEWYAGGMSAAHVANKLTEMKVPTYYGEHEWKAPSVKSMLINEVYIGLIRWDYRKNEKVVEDGAVVVKRPRNHEYLLYKGKHEAIISQELWDAAKKRHKSIQVPVKSKSKCENPFAGILFCECGERMQRQHRVKDGKDVYKPRLICESKSRVKYRRCSNGTCTVEEMEEEIIKVLKEAIEDFDIRIKNDISDSLAQYKVIVAQLEKELAELEKLEVSQWEKYTMEAMPEAIFRTLNEKVLKRKAEVIEGLCAAKDNEPEHIDYDAKRETFKTALDTMKDPKATPLQKNIILKDCIEKIVYSREELGRGGSKKNRKPFYLDVHLKL